MALLLGYNTNGFAHHRLDDALDAMASIGYRSVGLTIDVHHAPLETTNWDELREKLERLGLVPVIETGARFYLDPTRKHRPTLMDDDSSTRMKFLTECIGVAAGIGAPCVSLWSGTGNNWGKLVVNMEKLCERADAAGVDLAFEPEPGMLVDTMARFDQLRADLPHPRLGLTLDVGHLHCLEDEPPETCIERYAELLRNVHLDDHRKSVHEHLMFGEGEIDFAPVMAALRGIGAARDLPATVELSRHSHDAVATASSAWAFLASSSSTST